MESLYGWCVSVEDPSVEVCGCCDGKGVVVDEDGPHTCGQCGGSGQRETVEEPSE